jgi:uncharacterized phage protein (TIGR01671 family)
MREIKFRAWNPDSKKMTYIPDDGFLHLGANSFISRPDWFVSKKTDSVYESCAYSDRSILMQFTGLLDKRGKEIYEGDIVEIDGISAGVKEVNFNSGCFDFGNTCWGYGAEELNWRDIKILGNKFENPELLQNY